MYIKDSVLKTYPPKTSGFNSFIWSNGEAVYYPSMKSFEPGHHDHESFHRLSKALAIIEDIGIEHIHERINELMDYLITKLKTNSITIEGDFYEENRLGIITISSQKGLIDHLIANQIEVSERGGNIRIGLHYYNNEQDIDALIGAILSF